MIKSINAPWCNWPFREHVRELEDLYKVGARCNAWMAFLQSDTVVKLKEMKGCIIWFNRYEYFDKLICEFDCSEKKLRMTIESLIRPSHKMPIEFVRQDIYDARAWANLPLDCFTEVSGCNERSVEKRWQYEILKYNEMPVVQFGIKFPWVVSRSCFKLSHRLKNNERYAVMTFDHPQLDPRFDNKRWVAEKIFPRETTRKEMMEVLFTYVEKKCAKYLVTITD